MNFLSLISICIGRRITNSLPSPMLQRCALLLWTFLQLPSYGRKMSKHFLILLLFFLNNCRNTVDDSIIDSDESQILNLAFDNIIGPDSVYRFSFKHTSPPKALKPFSNEVDSNENKRIRRYWDSAIRLLDTATLFVVVNNAN